MCKIDQEMDLFNSSFPSSVQSHIPEIVGKTDKKATQKKKNEYKNRRESQTAQCLDTGNPVGSALPYLPSKTLAVSGDGGGRTI